ncbi:hypothetical protein DVH24_021386 [Malus domestica]|uniref:Reverse transcriptase Ty1/copia-type domain-containing protein n=1 Tax=Malus domestica TaxID=3750 RepID=A0A498K0Z5_MALDO|nr:hypothetical protein DVH24_021386 [Malus domestica]
MASMSSVEAKCRGMAHEICELLWLRKILRCLGFEPKESTKSYCDNKSAREIADNPVQHDRTKHVEVFQDSVIKFGMYDIHALT